MPDALLRLLVATLGGAAVGVERQWSGHASGPQARFGGVRTFSMLGALGGLAGEFWAWGAFPLAALVLALGGLLVLAGYMAASRADVDATTEVAALIVLAAGAAAGLGEMAVASGVVAVTALLLFEKSRLHDLIARAEGPDLRAAFRFAVMAVVILPLLPPGPIGSWGGGIRPRELWLLVLFFSGLSFVGYLAQRAVGASRGLVVAGLLGGMVSSTSVTLAYARHSRADPALAEPLARGVLAANTVLFLRVLAAAAILSPALSLALVPALAAPCLVGMAATLSGWRWRAHPSAELDGSHGVLAIARNPLQLRNAIEVAVLFQLVLFVVAFIGDRYGERGLLGTAAVLGLNDADALTLSMAREVEHGGVGPGLAARAVAVGLLSNSLVKALMSGSLGRGRFRTMTVTVLVTMAALLGAAGLLLNR